MTTTDEATLEPGDVESADTGESVKKRKGRGERSKGGRTAEGRSGRTAEKKAERKAEGRSGRTAEKKAERKAEGRGGRNADDKSDQGADDKSDRNTHRQVVSLRKRVKELEEANKRLVQVTDAVVEVLLPATEGQDHERLHKILADYHQPA